MEPLDNFVVTVEQNKDTNDGWIGEGQDFREDFKIDKQFSSTNTNYGGEDPGKIDSEATATFDPTY
jgi:hypothetical protein